jgi:hypothetical protein
MTEFPSFSMLKTISVFLSLPDDINGAIPGMTLAESVLEKSKKKNILSNIEL